MSSSRDFVWLFVVEVLALPRDAQLLEAGSKALLQCFVRASSFDAALPLVDVLLEQEDFRRLDLFRVSRFEPDASREDVNNPNISEGIDAVVRSGLSYRGMLFTAEESARWKQRPS